MMEAKENYLKFIVVQKLTVPVIMHDLTYEYIPNWWGKVNKVLSLVLMPSMGKLGIETKLFPHFNRNSIRQRNKNYVHICP